MTELIEIIEEQSYSLDITDGEHYAIEINDQTPTSIEVGIAVIGQRGERGADGIPGVAGPNAIGGYGFGVANPTPGDVLKLGTNNLWINAPEQELTDGGNF